MQGAVQRLCIEHARHDNGDMAQVAPALAGAAGGQIAHQRGDAGPPAFVRRQTYLDRIFVLHALRWHRRHRIPADFAGTRDSWQSANIALVCRIRRGRDSDSR